MIRHALNKTTAQPRGARRWPLLHISALSLLALALGLPIAAGLGQTLITGAPDLGAAWHGPSLGRTVFTALMATGAGFLAALGLAACFHGRVRLLTWLSLPLLAVPHAAVAQALGLLLAPSGFGVRFLSPWATGYDRPPIDWLWDQHPAGWTLIIALAIKELPYFLILIFTYTPAMATHPSRAMAAGLGYGPVCAWWHGILPLILPRLILPIFIVLTFTVSVVDVAAVVGPSRIKTFALNLQAAWSHDTSRSQVLAGASWLVLVTLVLLGFVWLFVKIMERHLRRAYAWRRSWPAMGLPQFGAALGLGLLALAYISLLVLPLQSLITTTGRQIPFPDLGAGALDTHAWGQALDLALPTLPLTLAIAMSATILSLGFALCLLEGEARADQRRGQIDILLLVPLLVPQFAFLGGGAFLGLKLGLIPAQGFGVAIWFHSFFVFPYVFLILAPAFRGLSPTYLRAAASLGLGPNAQFWRLKIPILLRPLVFSAAWGMAVSLALYLPTFFASGGRFETLLSVGVTQLAGKGDRVRAVWGLLLLILPLCFFMGAALISAWQARNRRGLRT